jgi:RHS repeat-associated protein
MTKDHRLSKDIRYNLLNLPREIEFAVSENSSRVIRYTYTASGQKISQQLMEDAGESVRRDYAGPFVYVNDTLAWINTPHGRIINRGFETDSVNLVKEFHLRDHLGNTRIVLEEDENNTYSETHIADYYPFGMEIQRGAGHTQPPANNKLSNRYLYNGKELQDDHDLNWGACPAQCGNYGARFYDPQIGRFHTIDPHAENYLPISTYAYVGNNPIIRIDPDGRDWYEDKDGNLIWRKGSKDIEGYTNKGDTCSKENEDGTYTNYYQNFGITAETEFDAKEFIISNKEIAGLLLKRNSSFCEEGKSDLFKSLIRNSQKSFLDNSAKVGAEVLEKGGEAVSYLGYATAPLGVGLPLIAGGNLISTIGTLGKAGFDIYDGDYENAGARIVLAGLSSMGGRAIAGHAKWAEREKTIVLGWLQGFLKAP